MRLIIYFFLLIASYSCSISKEYYGNGKIEKKGSLIDGKKNGEWKYYSTNGKYIGGGKYVNGKRNGEWKWYHESKELQQIGVFLNDKQTGEWNFFHPNGNREGVGTFIEGKRDGVWKWYHTNGEIYTEREWQTGKLLKIISCYDGEGNKLDKGTFSGKNGTMKLYDIEGNLTRTLNYVNGQYIE